MPKFNILQVQATPNPNARKFVVDGVVSQSPVSFFTAEAAAGHPLAAALFAIDGVSNVLLLGDFVTVGKRPEARWPAIVAAVRKVMRKI